MFIENDLYKEIIDNTVIQTIDIVFINNSNKILLGLRNNKPLKGIYYIPGGRRYKNETIIESAKRKAKEELGIDIDENKLIFIGVYDDIFEDSIYDNIGTHCSPITYLYNLSEDEEINIKNDSQHKDFIFFDLNDESLHKMVKMRINDVKKIIL